MLKHRNSPATSTEQALLLPCLGTLAGAWLGAFPIPLDWEAPWQSALPFYLSLSVLMMLTVTRRWPVTICYGALAGSIAGHAISALILGWTAVAKEEVEVKQDDSKKKKQ